MKIIKRNGTEEAFDITKIMVAVGKANATVEEGARLTPVQIRRIAQAVENAVRLLAVRRAWRKFRILWKSTFMANGAYEVAKQYITYRYTRNLVRRSNTTDDKILSLIECNNEESQAGKFQQEPDSQQRAARLYGGRGQP